MFRLKNLPEMWGTCIRSLSWEDPLEKGMTTHSSILAWIIPWTEEPAGLQSTGSQSWTRLSDSHTNTHTQTHVFIWPSWVLAVAHRMFNLRSSIQNLWLWYSEFPSLTRDGTQAPYIGPPREIPKLFLTGPDTILNMIGLWVLRCLWYTLNLVCCNSKVTIDIR